MVGTFGNRWARERVQSRPDMNSVGTHRQTLCRKVPPCIVPDVEVGGVCGPFVGRLTPSLSAGPLVATTPRSGRRPISAARERRPRRQSGLGPPPSTWPRTDRQPCSSLLWARALFVVFGIQFRSKLLISGLYQDTEGLWFY